MGAEEVSPLPGTGEKSGPLPMNARFPGSVNVPMAFATEPVAFCEIEELSIVKPQFISILSVVAVKAPPHRLSMMELDIGMFLLQLPLFSVHLHGGMAVAAGKHALCHRKGGDRELLFDSNGKGDKTKP